MAVSFIGGGWRFLCHQRVDDPPNSTPVRFTTTSTRWSCLVPRALDPKTGGDHNSTNSTQVEDLVYVAKVAAGSFAGAGAIKYGSALFPEITNPNLVLAIGIILTPVVVAVLLLIKESGTKV